MCLARSRPMSMFSTRSAVSPKCVVRIPDRHLVADRGAHVEDRLDLAAGHAERDHAFAVVVHDRHHVRPRLVERAVDEALEIGRAAARIDRVAFEREFHDVGGLDAVGRARAREQIALRIVGMARADMAEGIDDRLAGEDAVGGDELFDDPVELGHQALSFLIDCFAVILCCHPRESGIHIPEACGYGSPLSRGRQRKVVIAQRIKLTEPSVPSS